MFRPFLRRFLAFAASAAIAAAAVVASASSETPPEGPPWKREFAAAQKDALSRGVPIFVYLTKVY